ncbi:MAG: hypothetical protein M1401_07795 [Chloroflexi bacterium]|nr:hypothetical protein [Chloroflexota bacterium]
MNNIEVFMIASAKMEIERLERQAGGPLASEYLSLRPSEVHRTLLRQWLEATARARRGRSWPTAG